MMDLTALSLIADGLELVLKGLRSMTPECGQVPFGQDPDFYPCVLIKGHDGMHADREGDKF